MGLFKKKVKEESIEVKKNWYADRYQTVVVQRNFLALISIISLACIILSVLSVTKIASSKTIEPFVIEVEEKTGITNVIRPLQSEKYAYDETLRRYFLYQYLTKRESYDYLTYERDYFVYVRLLSDPSVYAGFRQSISSNNNNSPIRLGQTTRTVKIKSIAFPPPVKDQIGFTAQIRFQAEDRAGTKHKVALINFVFSDLELTQEERAINPLGFQVIGYRVEDEILQ